MEGDWALQHPAQLLHCSPSWDQPGGNCIPLRQVKQPFCTGSLCQCESPKFLRPYPKTAVLEESAQHLTQTVPHTCPLSQSCHSSEHPREGMGPALLPGTPHAWQRMGIVSGVVALLLSAHTSPRSALCSPASNTSPGGEGSAPGERPPPPQVRKQAKPHNVCLAPRVRSMTPSYPASSDPHLPPDGAVTTVRALLKGETATTQPLLLTEQGMHCHFLKRP